MDNQLILQEATALFDEVRHIRPDGSEFWYARELMELLGYTKWENFHKVIDKAIISMKSSYPQTEDHFPEVRKMITIATGTSKSAVREIVDFELTRRACYIIAQNGDSSKHPIALAQAYFAIQTRRQELQEDRQQALERIAARRKLSLTEKRFSGVLAEHEVDSMGIAEIRSAGDEALFKQPTNKMKAKLGAHKGKPLADYLPTITLKAKDLATEITTFNTDVRNLAGKAKIKREHVNNNSAVRELLNEKGIYPEDLPPEKDIKSLEKLLKIHESEDYVIDHKFSKENLTISIIGVADVDVLQLIKNVIEANPGDAELVIIYGPEDNPKQMLRSIEVNAEVVRSLAEYIYI